MTLSLTSSSEKVKIHLDKVQNRPTVIYQDQQLNFLRLPIYTQDDYSVSGIVNIDFGSQRIKHNGIFIQLIGITESYHKEDEPEEFLYLSKEIEKPGKLKGSMSYTFNFDKFEPKYETYYGLAGRIRYYVKAVIQREVKASIKSEEEFAVHLPLLNMFYHHQLFEIQLRIADYLMINVSLNKTNFHTGECVIGKIVIEKIQLIIKRIQISLVKREITNPTLALTCTQEEILKKVELSNKCPKKGELFPFKLNLSSLDISPVLLQSNTKMVVKYILILSFIDEDDRSLFKPIELNIWRKKEVNK